MRIESMTEMERFYTDQQFKKLEAKKQARREKLLKEQLEVIKQKGKVDLLV